MTTLLHIPNTQTNILQINEKIIDYITSKKCELDNLYDIYNDLLQECDTFEKERSRKIKLELVRECIVDIETTFELGVYLLQTRDIIFEFNNLNIGPISFYTKNKDSTQLYKKHSLFSNYISIANNFARIEYTTPHAQSQVMCMSCHSTKFLYDDENRVICSNCGIIIELADDSACFKDNERINMSQKFKYTKINNFKLAIKKYGGKENVEIPDSVIQKIKQSMAHLHIQPDQITKDQLYTILSQNKLSKYYENINLIHYLITDKPPPNIDEYEPELLRLFEQMEAAYEKLKDPGRINSLNVIYKLFRLLQIAGYKCKLSDFYTLKTDSKLKEHNEKFEEIRKLCDWQKY